MKKTSFENLSLQKTALRAAFSRQVINEQFYLEEMERLNRLEEEFLKQRRLKAIKDNDTQHRLNEYVFQ